MAMMLLRSSDHGNTFTDRSRKAERGASAPANAITGAGFASGAKPIVENAGAADAAPATVSNGFQIDCGRLAVLSLLELVGDLLILVETAEAGAFHRRDVHEHVLGLVVRLDEAETLARVEPFHGAGRHGFSPWIMSPRAESVRGIKFVRGRKPEAARPERECRGL